ncbi:alcohol dehydrogenase catalytic domain-containing protein [Ideonella azotifigens]|uniref:Alcohol dehydrogenase catalytic domain-containing protein n=1 Tax=Ideonella azotifigens TaxID=513160 RepID=A0ABN1KMQ7_9BURK|nr:alcohol dehydrogenase catalytic domain-containing protein [Ideonella azotifigens]MCD2344969.1 alcohol dehydrogenase catalytic domain-containing protein [Ideonella azotifigens]
MNEKLMRAARLHELDGRFQIDRIPVPEPRPTDVLVKVAAAGLVHNLRNVLTIYPKVAPFLPLPKLPAIFGLDTTGVVASVGSLVKTDVKVGDRVYVNPGLSCGSCEACRRADPTNCRNFTFMGYFGFGPESQNQYDAYPYGGFSEYATCPVGNVVKLPDNLSFEQASRFGYLGTAYAGLRKANFKPGQRLLVNGGTGTLGVGAVLLGLAMGASKVFATGRDPHRLEKLRQLDPHRIVPVSSRDGTVAAQAMEATGGNGVDAMLEALAPGAPASSVMDAFHSLRHGGVAVNVGGVSEALAVDAGYLMITQRSLVGSLWFTTSEGQDMAQMVEAGTLDLSVFEHKVYSLEEVNTALVEVDGRDGGFTNFVVRP